MTRELQYDDRKNNRDLEYDDRRELREGEIRAPEREMSYEMVRSERKLEVDK